MAKMSDSAVPSLILTETAAASVSTPAGGTKRFFIDTDHAVKTKDSSGSVVVVSGGAAATPTDGWVDDSAHTWTYASASTFTIAGVDLTAVFTPGTRLKFTQTTVKYAVVVSSAFSTNTTVTIAVNTDYTIANAAITLNYYSYAANPPAWPTWFNYTPTIVGYSGGGTADFATFSVVGRNCFVQIRIIGTSTGTSLTFTVPITPAHIGSQTPDFQNLLARIRDNSNWAVGLVSPPSSGSVFVVASAIDGTTTFTASNSKAVIAQFWYAI